jgi:adenylyl-sulfate kinase
VQTFYLDGDNVRHGLNGDLGFSAEDRKENIRRVAEVAKLAFEHGSVVICTFISPFAADRDFARTLIPDPHFLEIYVKCDLEVVKRRDPKGLYARALRGEIPEFTGVSSPYEAPAAAELVVETDVRSAEEIVEEIWEELIRRGVAP